MCDHAIFEEAFWVATNDNLALITAAQAQEVA